MEGLPVCVRDRVICTGARSATAFGDTAGRGYNNKGKVVHIPNGSQAYVCYVVNDLLLYLSRHKTLYFISQVTVDMQTHTKLNPSVSSAWPGPRFEAAAARQPSIVPLA